MKLKLKTESEVFHWEEETIIMKEMLKQTCPEGILNQVQNDTFRVQHDIFFVTLNLFQGQHDKWEAPRFIRQLTDGK